MAYVKVQHPNGTQMTVDEANLSIWTGAGWTLVEGSQSSTDGAGYSGTSGSGSGASTGSTGSTNTGSTSGKTYYAVGIDFYDARDNHYITYDEWTSVYQPAGARKVTQPSGSTPGPKPGSTTTQQPPVKGGRVKSRDWTPTDRAYQSYMTGELQSPTWTAIVDPTTGRVYVKTTAGVEVFTSVTDYRNQIAGYSDPYPKNPQTVDLPANKRPATPTQSQPPTEAAPGLDPNERYYLINFTGDPTPSDNQTSNALPWLFDSQTKKYYPFTDQVQIAQWAQANNLDPMKFFQSASTLTPAQAQSGDFQGTFLSTAYTPRADGTVPTAPEQTGTAVTERYGQDPDYQAETQAMNIFGNLILPEWEAQGILSAESLDLLKSDPELLAKYISATTYGGYTAMDIWRDLKLKELQKTNPAYANRIGISETMSASEFKLKSPDYKFLANDQNLMPPAETVEQSILFGAMGYQILEMPDAFFKEQVKTIDWRKGEWKAVAEGIAAGYYDFLQAKLQASTDQEKAIADYNYNEFIKNTNRTYGINLSNDVEEAWKQIQALEKNYQARNLSGSGLLEEARDRYLADVREREDVMRTNKDINLDSQERTFLLNSATPQQLNEAIARMDTEDGEKGLPLDQYRSRTWGLVPTQAVLGEFTLESLKKKYPDYSDDQLRLLRDTVLDEFGHYRSNLYQQAIGKKLQIGLDKQDYQMGKVLENANQEAKRAIDATKKGDGLSPNPDMKYDFNTGTRQGDRIVYTDGSFQYVGATGPNYKRYDSSGSSLGYGVPNTGYDFQDAVKGAGAVSNNLAPNTYNSKVNALPSTPFSSMLSTDKTLYNKAGGAVQPGDLPAGWTVDENSRITKL